METYPGPEVFGSFKGELYNSLSDSAAMLNCALDDSLNTKHKKNAHAYLEGCE